MSDTDQDKQPVRVVGETRNSRWLILCDHATNTVPACVNGGSLGLPASEMARHIAYDIGAERVAVQLANQLCAPAVLANFSRLVIDPNRGLDDPTLVRRLYDGTIIPANRHLTAEDIADRVSMFYRPYHDKVARLAARRPDTVIVSVHSFTRQLHHHPPRPWHVGLLFAGDDRLSRPLMSLLRDDGGLVVGENQPYSGDLAGDTIDQHGLQHRRQNTLIEIRNDLITDDAGQAQWANRLARLLPQALDLAETEGG